MMHKVPYKNTLFTSRAASVLAACCLTLMLSSTYAQTGTSTVRGTVSEQTGAVIHGATVTLRDAEKKFTRSQTTNDDGGYAFKELPPDTYIIQVETPGFKKSVVTGVKLGANLSVEVNIALELGRSDISKDAPVRERIQDINPPVVEFRSSFFSACGAESYVVKDSAGGYFLFTTHTPDMPHPITVDNPHGWESTLSVDSSSTVATDRPLRGTELELLVKLLKEWRDSAIPKQKLRLFKHYAGLKDDAAINKVLKSLSEADSELLSVWFVIGELEQKRK
jgi:hypothetical protein